MSRNFVSVIGYVAALAFFTASPVLTAQFGTADEAKAMKEEGIEFYPLPVLPEDQN